MEGVQCCTSAPSQTSKPNTHPLTNPTPHCQGVSYGIQNGCHLSRARVLYFKHNDADDLERVLQQVAREDRKHRWVLHY